MIITKKKIDLHRLQNFPSQFSKILFLFAGKKYTQRKLFLFFYIITNKIDISKASNPATEISNLSRPSSMETVSNS